MPGDYYNLFQKEIVFSVPTVWPDAAKIATHALDFTLKGEVAFIVCNAGGGTVDLISYEVIGLDRLQVKEQVPGTGGMAGSE